MYDNGGDTYCLMCDVGACPVSIQEDGTGRLRVSPIGPDICKNGALASETLESENRITDYMQRVGVPGEGLFEIISAEQFIENVAQDMVKYFGKAGWYNGRGGFDDTLWRSISLPGEDPNCTLALPYIVDSPHASGAGALCYAAKNNIVLKSMFGVSGDNIIPDYDNADLILIFGANPKVAGRHEEYRKLKQAKDRGARIISIDPVRNATAKGLGLKHFEEAENLEWVPIHPGTDAILAYAVMGYLHHQGALDLDEIEQNTTGFKSLEKVIQSTDIGTAALLTGIPEDKIIDIAEAIKENASKEKGFVINTYSGLEFSEFGIENLAAVYSLPAVTGGFNKPGGMMIQKNDMPKLNRIHVKAPVADKSAGAESFPAYIKGREGEAHAFAFPQAMFDGRIKMLGVTGASLLASWSYPKLWETALLQLDSLVYINPQPVPGMRYAKFIAPVRLGCEKQTISEKSGKLRFHRQVTETRKDIYEDAVLHAKIGNRVLELLDEKGMNLPEIYDDHGKIYNKFPESMEEIIQALLRGTGIDYDELVSSGEIAMYDEPLFYETLSGLPTASGKIELMPQIQKRLTGFKDIGLEQRIASKQRSQQRSGLLSLISGIRQPNYQFRTRQTSSRLIGRSRPTAYLHPDDAEELGLGKGDFVRISHPVSDAEVYAFLNITRDIMKGVINVDMGWMDHPDFNFNVNHLIDEFDRVSGFPSFRSALVSVEQADAIGLAYDAMELKAEILEKV